MNTAERLQAAIHLESAAIAPQTSPLIEAAKEMLIEHEKLLEDLRSSYADRLDLQYALTDIIDRAERTMNALSQEIK